MNKSLQQLKVSVLARVKRDLGIECNNHNLKIDNAEASSSDFELSAKALLSEENLFQAVREEVIYLMK